MLKVNTIYFFLLISVLVIVSCQEKSDKGDGQRDYSVLDLVTIDSFLVANVPDRLTRKEEDNGDVFYSKISTTEFIKVRVFNTLMENPAAFFTDSALTALVSNSKSSVDTSQVIIELDRKEYGHFKTNQFVYGKIGLRRFHYGIRAVDGQCVEISTSALSKNGEFEKEVTKLFTEFSSL